jgi:hypothetical protein
VTTTGGLSLTEYEELFPFGYNMSDQSYCYKPLQQHRGIRLLKLLPGSWEDGICCELEITSLSKQPKYEALSYAWGDKGNSRCITVDGQPFSIGTMLELALRRLRNSESPRILWVDCLCINQKDVHERNNQVALMQDIFLDTQMVLIWLGEPESKDNSTTSTRSCEHEWGDIFKDSQRIFHFMQRVNNYHAHPIAIRHHPEQDYELGAFCFIAELSYNKHMPDISFFRKVMYWRNVSKALSQIMLQDWWKRIWAVQEAVLAPHATIIYGRFRCPWGIFASAAKSFRQHRLMCCSEFLDGFDPQDTKIPRNFSKVVLGIEGARHQWRDEQHTTLLHLLWQFRWRNSSDPRDKVYSLLSLVKSWGSRLPIRPDYSLTAEQLYVIVVQELIKVTGNLSALMGTLTKSRELASLPSWVPDWTYEPPSFELDRLERGALYKASENRSPVIRYPSDGFLECRGLITATIDTVGDEMPSNLGDPALKIFQRWEELAGLHNDSDWTYVAGGTAGQAYWRTLCLDSLYMLEAGPSGFCKRRFVRAPRKYGSSMKFWRSEARSWNLGQECNRSDDCNPLTVAAGNRMPPELQPYWIDMQNGPISRPPTLVEAINYAVLSATAHRRFFMTEQRGYMGLGPSTLKKGDKICVLLGGCTPFIIRPIGNREVGSSVPKPCYELIGDCYVDGLMDGQVFSIPALTEESIYLGPCASKIFAERAKI